MSTSAPQQANRARLLGTDEDSLAIAVMVELHRLVKQATLYVSENEAQKLQLAAMQQAVLEFGRRTGANPRIYFSEQSVYIGRRLFRAGRHVYESALEVAQILARFGVDEIAIGYDIPIEELKQFQTALGLALRNAGPPPQQIRYARLRLRKGRPLKARRMNENLPPQEVLVRSYCLAVVAVRRFLESIQRGKVENIQPIQRVAEQLVDITHEMATKQTPAFLAGVVLYNVRHESAGRAVNAAMLSLAMARQVTEQLAALARIAMASLLYDVGLPRVAGLGPEGEERVGVMMPRIGLEQERELPAATAALMTALNGCSDAGMTHTALVYEALSLNLRDNAQAAYQAAHPISLEARIVATARRFTELLADPDEERTAEQAMMAVLGGARDEADKMSARLLSAALGMYPPGTMVELSTGHVVRVLQTPNDPRRFGFPVVLPVLDSAGGRVDNAEPYDLEQGAAEGVHITRVVALGEATREDPRSARRTAAPAVQSAAPAAPASALRTVGPAMPSPSSPPTPHTPASPAPVALGRVDVKPRGLTPAPRAAAVPLAPPPPEPVAVTAVEANDFADSLATTADTSDALAIDLPADAGQLAPFGAGVQGVEAGDSVAVGGSLDEIGSSIETTLETGIAPEADDALEVQFDADEGIADEPSIGDDATLFVSDVAASAMAVAAVVPPKPQASPTPPIAPRASPEPGIAAPPRAPVAPPPRPPSASVAPAADGAPPRPPLPPPPRPRADSVAPASEKPALPPPPRPSAAPPIELELEVEEADVDEALLEGADDDAAPDFTEPAPDSLDSAADEINAAFAAIELPDLEEAQGLPQTTLDLPPLSEEAARRLYERSQPVPDWFEERAADLTPTAQGTLKKTPLVHLLVYLLDQRKTGTVVFTPPDGNLCAFRVEEGVPSKVRVPAGVAPLDEVLTSLGLIDSEVVAEARVAIETNGELLGQYLVSQEQLDPSMLEIALNMQATRKLEHLFALGEGTTYMFFADADLLASYGGEEPIPVDPLALITAGVRQRSGDPLIDAMLARLGQLALTVHPLADTLRLGFEGEESDVIALLVEQPRPLATLIQSSGIAPEVVKRTVYTLAITRSLNLGAQAKPPVGIEGAAPPSGTDFAPPSVSSYAPASSRPAASQAPLASSPVAPPASSSAVGDAPPTSQRSPGKPLQATSTATSNEAVRTRPAVEVTRTAPARASSPGGATSSPGTPPPSQAPTAASGAATSATPAAAGPRKGPTREEVEARAATIEEETFFQILGVQEDTPASAVQSAYFALAKIWHPDRTPNDLQDLKPVVAKVFTRVTEAFQTLTEPTKRAAYLESLKSGGTKAEREFVEKAVDSAMLFEQARVLFKRGSLAQTELTLQRCVNADPQPDYQALLAWVQVLRMGDPPALQPGQKVDTYRAQLAMLDAALAESPNFADGYFYRAEVYKRSGMHEQAIKDYKRVVQLNPRNIDAAREIRIYEMRNPKAAPGAKPGQPGAQPQGGLFGKLFKKE